MNRLVYTRLEIFRMIKDLLKSDLGSLLKTIEENCAKKIKDPFEMHRDDAISLNQLVRNIRLRWKTSHRMSDRFLENNENWLNCSITIRVSTVLSYY